MQVRRLGTQTLILQPAIQGHGRRGPHGSGGASDAVSLLQHLPIIGCHRNPAAPARQVGKVAAVVAIGLGAPLIFLIAASRLTMSFNEL